MFYLQDLCDSLPLAQKQKVLTYSIPENRSLKKLLGYNEDTYLNFTELTTKYNYTYEEHTVITEDGYILTVYRIPSKCKGISKYLPVVLVHGLYDSSDAWILSGPKDGLAYILADNCYDVWIPNTRGNRYSRKHIFLDPDKDIEYWNFSFDEQGNYDVPAVIDYVLNVTSELKLFYIGHSQGTTDFFIMASLRPEYNSKIYLSIQLAPIAWFKYINSPILKFIAQFSPLLKSYFDAFGVGELLARGQLIHIIVEYLCQIAPQEVCGTALGLTTGLVKDSIRSSTLSVAFGHLLVGVSAKTLAHFGQLILSKKFERYNEGKTGNLKRYGTEKTPEYNVTNISSPVLLICSQNDWVSSLKDANELSSRLSNLVEAYIVPNIYWSHNNHLWGKDAQKLVFKKILDYLHRYSNNEN
ncbi:Lipase 1 [Papilio xuthus]|uniref:Lipase n=1 Tax=Papilio xuthus TaxID=66420 RepID=A0A194PRT8_PAPXU|nr:Lipase 1 [Papilio xuthus]